MSTTKRAPYAPPKTEPTSTHSHRAKPLETRRKALCRTRTDDPFLTMEVLYQLS
jgi:hypothetical protein